MLRKFATVFGTFGVLAGGVLLIGFMGQLRPDVERQEPDIAPPTVFFTTATPQNVTLDVSAQGEVRPRTDIALTAQISGIITETSPVFVNGGAFEKGDLLIQIEDQDYKYAVTSAASQVAQAREILEREKAESALAEQDFKELGGEISASELTLRKPQLAQARANYDAARANLQAAKLNLKRTNITAPFAGRVRERLVGPGQFVSPGAQLGRVFATDVAEIRLPLSDDDMAKLGLSIAFVETDERPGPKVELSTVLAGRFHTWTGRLTRTDGAIDPATRQISAIAVVEDPYGAGSDNGAPLAIGLFVDASIKGQPYENAFILPRTALYGRDRIYVVDADNTLKEHTVSVVAAGRDTVTVARGVRAGDHIVTSPLRGAGDGDEVTPEAAALPLIAGSVQSIQGNATPADPEEVARARARAQTGAASSGAYRLNNDPETDLATPDDDASASGDTP
ncbi:MAG: efflux RND transporter periplasmic adaptor subunit [Pseudomonadota bacterium]